MKHKRPNLGSQEERKRIQKDIDKKKKKKGRNFR